MKVYVTKYALTKGIEEVEVEETHTPTMVATKGPYSQCFHGEGKDWHRQKWQAVARANQMRNKKIESLKKLIVKLEKMSF